MIAPPAIGDRVRILAEPWRGRSAELVEIVDGGATVVVEIDRSPAEDPIRVGLRPDHIAPINWRPGGHSPVDGAAAVDR